MSVTRTVLHYPAMQTRNWVIETITEQTKPVRQSFKAGSKCFCCRVLKHCARMTYDHSSAEVTKRRARPERAHHRMSVYIFVDITSHIAGFGCRMTAMICPLYLLCYLFPYSSRIFQTNIPEALVFRANFSQSFHILFPSSWLVTI